MKNLDSERIIYRNVQPGTFVRITIGVVGIVLLALSIVSNPYIYICLGVLVICFLLFHSLSTEVTESSIRIRMGIGVIHRTIPIARVRSCVTARTPWYIGWGIRLIPGRCWLWNVSGFDSVELEYQDGGHFRIGTDTPRELAEAIDEAIALQNHDDPVEAGPSCSIEGCGSGPVPLTSSVRGPSADP